LGSPLNAFALEGQTLFHVAQQVDLAGMRLSAHLYLDEKRRASEIEQLIRRVTEIESAFQGKKVQGKAEALKHFCQTFQGAEKLFTLTVKKGKVQLARQEKRLAALMERMGKMILLTKDATLTGEELLLLYRRKEELEKLFDILKNEIQGGRLRVSSKTAMEGRLFLYYLALILYAALHKLMKKTNLYKTYTLAEVLAELKKLRRVRLSNGKCYLTELSKRQRSFFEKFELISPAEPSY
jgi:transposase